MKKVILFATVLALVPIGDLPVHGAKPCAPQMVETWAYERDRAVDRLLKGWLRGEPWTNLRQEDLEITRFEIYLSTCPNSHEIGDLYFSEQIPDDERAPAHLFLAYMRRRGYDLSPKVFFEGKRFQILIKGGNR